MINARAETVERSPAFRTSLLRWRCIVPADGFYEWRRDGRQRRPYLITPREAGPLALAGLWAPWRDPHTGEWLLSAAVITTPANATLATLHDRMPAILPVTAWSAWLDPALHDPAPLRGLLAPAPDDLLALTAVSPRVNSPHNEGPDLIVPIAGAAETAPDQAAALTLFDQV